MPKSPRSLARAVGGAQPQPPLRRPAPRLLLGLLAALGVASLTAGCATAPGAPSTPSAPRTTLPDLDQRSLLILMADQRRFDPLAVSTAVRGTTPLRRQAALTLGRVGDRRGVPVLESLLADGDAGVREAAVFSLGLLAERGHPSARQALTGAAGDPSRRVGVTAVEAMARAGASLEDAVKALVLAPADELLPRLAPSLFRFRGPSVVRWAEQGLEIGAEQGDPALRRSSAYGLAREPQPEGAPALRRLLTDDDPWIRGWAARGLGRVGDGGDLARLRPLIDDPEPGPVIHALRSGRQLAAEGVGAAPDDWRERLLALMDDPRPGVRLTAIEASAAWLLDTALEDRLERFARSGAEREQELALLALGEAASAGLALLLPELAGASSPSVRAAAARVTALTGPAELLGQLAVDGDGLVRRTALESLLDLAAAGSGEDGLSEEAARLVASALEDDDVGVRSTLLNWAAEHPLVPGTVLVQALDRARRDREIDARLAAVDALAARAERVASERPSALAVLGELAGDKEFVLRRQAAAALASLGEEAPALGPIETGRSSVTYRQIAEQTAAPKRFLLSTRHGAVELEVDCPEAPLHCLSFLQLAGQGFYDGLRFHRIVPDFVVQGGDPRGDGLGGPGYSLRDEPTLRRYDRGVLGMARAGRDTGGSQFFITLSPQPHLDGAYTAFGRVVSGVDVLDRLVQGDTIESLRPAGVSAP
ncbi:MAG: peptidylprolyl isomerase [Acidobacteriota bacterium]